jgi:hypothetical protein
LAWLSIGLLGLLMIPIQAAAILVVLSLITHIWQAVVGGRTCAADVAIARRHFHRHFNRRAAAAHDGNGRATVWLGLALAAYEALGLVNGQFSVPRHAGAWLRHGDRRHHGRDWNLRYAGDALSACARIRTRQDGAGAWHFVHDIHNNIRTRARAYR